MTKGSKKNPNYEEVCEGITGHAEVAHIYHNLWCLVFIFMSIYTGRYCDVRPSNLRLRLVVDNVLDPT